MVCLAIAIDEGEWACEDVACTPIVSFGHEAACMKRIRRMGVVRMDDEGHVDADADARIYHIEQMFDR